MYVFCHSQLVDVISNGKAIMIRCCEKCEKFGTNIAMVVTFIGTAIKQVVYLTSIIVLLFHWICLFGYDL